jgi:hypothetical protein
MNEENLAAALKPGDKDAIMKEINDTLAWIENKVILNCCDGLLFNSLWSVLLRTDF